MIFIAEISRVPFMDRHFSKRSYFGTLIGGLVGGIAPLLLPSESYSVPVHGGIAAGSSLAGYVCGRFLDKREYRKRMEDPDYARKTR